MEMEEYRLPAMWTKPLQTIKQELLIESLTSGPRHKFVSDQFSKTMPSNFKIINIMSIQNVMLWQIFGMGLKQTEKKNKMKAETQYLWHGSRNTDPKIIYEGEEGFNVIYSSDGMWGKGLYFAQDASYSHKYAHQHENGVRGMFLSLLNVGKIANVQYKENVTRKFRSPPNQMDSVKGQAKYKFGGELTDSDVIVVYANKKAYPMYYVLYNEESVKDEQEVKKIEENAK